MSLVLAGPGLAAPPASPLTPDSDNAAILAAIDAADPAYATNPAPVEQVVVAAELAEHRLGTAEDVDSAAELLMLAGAARRIAAQRAPADARAHLCAMLADSELILGRAVLADQLAELANGLKTEALDGLKGAECSTGAPPPAPPRVEPFPAAEGPAPLPVPKDSPVSWRPRSRIVAASALGAVGVGLLGWMGGALVARARAEDVIATITEEAMAAGREFTAGERAAVYDANDRHRRLDGTAKAVGIAGGVILLTSLAVLLVPPRGGSRARVRASAAGLVYSF